MKQYLSQLFIGYPSSKELNKLANRNWKMINIFNPAEREWVVFFEREKED